MEKHNKPTAPGKGYIDGIEDFYPREELAQVLIDATKKQLSKDDPFEGRAYIVIKALPDAEIGKVLRPAIDWETGKAVTDTKASKWPYMYNWRSKYAGRQSFLHREIVETETTWFFRIN